MQTPSSANEGSLQKDHLRRSAAKSSERILTNLRRVRLCVRILHVAGVLGLLLVAAFLTLLQILQTESGDSGTPPGYYWLVLGFFSLSSVPFMAAWGLSKLSGCVEMLLAIDAD